MIPRRNPLQDISLAPYQEPMMSNSYVPPPMETPQFAPMNIEHAQFAPDQKESGLGAAIGGIGTALLGRQRKPKTVYDSPMPRQMMGRDVA